MERRKQENELKQVKLQEQHFECIKEQWKSSSNTSSGKKRERSDGDDEGGHGERRKKKTPKRKRKDKNVKTRDEPEEDVDMEDQPEEEAILINEQEDDRGVKAQDYVLAAAGLEDSDVEDDMLPGMDSSNEANSAVVTEVGWYLLGENQEHVGPYALSELQGIMYYFLMDFKLC